MLKRRKGIKISNSVLKGEFSVHLFMVISYCKVAASDGQYRIAERTSTIVIINAETVTTAFYDR